jgi:hypothetical protein
MKFRKYIIFSVLLIFLVRGIVFSSSLPDGLETVAYKLHFISAEKAANWSLLGDYQFSDKLPPVVNHILSAVVGGTVLIFLSIGIVKLMNRKTNEDKGNS